MATLEERRTRIEAEHTARMEALAAKQELAVQLQQHDTTLADLRAQKARIQDQIDAVKATRAALVPARKAKAE